MKNKIYISILVLLSHFLFTNLIAQDIPCLKCVKDPLAQIDFSCVQEYDISILPVLYTEQQRYDFYKKMRTLVFPSTLSVFTNLKYNYYGYQKKPFVLDFDLNMPIAINGPNFLGLNTFILKPAFQFRIFLNDTLVPFGIGDRSLPVRTPSEKPGMGWYKSTKKLWASPDNRNLSLTYFGIYAYHHSNGQDGPEIDSLQSFGEVNTYNGNFSENLIFNFIIGGEISVSDKPSDYLLIDRSIFKQMNHSQEYTLKTGQSRELHWNLLYEYHPSFLSNKVFQSYKTYGLHRAKFNLTFIQSTKLSKWIKAGDLWCLLQPETKSEKFRHSLDLSYILDPDYYRGNFVNPSKIGAFDLSKRLNINYTFFIPIQSSDHFAWFGQIGYFGSDEYNIYFNENYFNLRAGVAFGFFDQINKSNYNHILN